MSASSTELLTTPLNALHIELGARMVPFAGYSMPVQYPEGLMAEHKQTRESAGLFDVSHMGQVKLIGADAAAALESIMPVDVLSLEVDKQRYGLFQRKQMFHAPVTTQGFLDIGLGRSDADILHLCQHLAPVPVPLSCVAPSLSPSC